MGLLDGLINVALLLAILVVLVVVHEFGHFVTARLAGVRVHEFGIGFPPRARVFARDRETIYTLNWLPLGGFVRLEGEEGQSDDPRSFVRQSLPVRLVILLAGVFMNFLLAWLIFSLIAGAADPSATVRIGTVQPDSPAARAGLVGGESGETIVAVDGRVFSWFDRPDGPLVYLRSRAGNPVTLTVRDHEGRVRDVTATLRPPDQVNDRQGALGIAVAEFAVGEDIRRDPASALAKGWERTLQASALILTALRDLFADLTRPQVAGPIGIVGALATVRTEAPPIFLLWLMGLLSANLAVVNVLPFPPMDGGRIAMSVLQAVTGNRISVSLERATYLVGFVLLMAFLVWISYFDIRRLGGGT